MSGLENGLAVGAAWGVLLYAIGRDELAKVIADFRRSLRPRPSAPARELSKSVVTVQHPQQRSAPKVSVAAPLVRPLRTPTVEELEQWIRQPLAPDPEWRVQ